MKHKISTIPTRGLVSYAIPVGGHLDIIIEGGYSIYKSSSHCIIQSQADNKILVKAGGVHYTLERGCYIPLSISALGTSQIYFFGAEGDKFTLNSPLIHSASWYIDLPDEPQTFTDILPEIDF